MRICGTHLHTNTHADATCIDTHTFLCTSAACIVVNPPLRKRFPAAHKLRETHTHTFTHTWCMRSHHISLMRHRQQQQEMMIKAYFHRFSILFDEFLHTFLEAALTHVRSLRPRAFPREQQREREGARDESEREAVRA